MNTSSSDSSGENGIEISGDDFHSDLGLEEDNKELSYPVFNPSETFIPLLRLIRKYDPNHQCGMSYHVKNVNSVWLSKKYVDAFRADPKKNVKGFRNEAIRDIMCHISPFQAYRAKKKALKQIEGHFDDQYAKLWDYAHALRMKNPGSTVLMALSDETDAIGKKKFDRIYICFKALKQEFLNGCRPLIRVDGCHLKGPHGGILLTVVSIDPNNQLFPLAYAVVGSESKQSWEWFLMNLKEDLCIERDDVYTFISDKQKGLIPAFETVFPARATANAEFDRVMKEIGVLDVKALEWLSDKPHSKWYTVNLVAHTCSCRKWELTGIPYKHGMSAICAQVLDPVGFVHSCYQVQTYTKEKRITRSSNKSGNTSNDHSQGGTSVFAPTPAPMAPIQHTFVSNPCMKPSTSTPFIKDGKKIVKVLDLPGVLSSSSKAKMQTKEGKRPT
ncbi:UNVERIFIED_CONTAM: hypothetical protein Sradi_2507300 [Sesamum radiatum]|uniref:SWIM-type domain-containing protein n=1 Tax=Sesamum radiatum TaxID=300843 RepID=A0AAW2SJY3_SESRA